MGEMLSGILRRATTAAECECTITEYEAKIVDELEKLLEGMTLEDVRKALAKAKGE